MPGRVPTLDDLPLVTTCIYANANNITDFTLNAHLKYSCSSGGGGKNLNRCCDNIMHHIDTFNLSLSLSLPYTMSHEHEVCHLRHHCQTPDTLTLTHTVASVITSCFHPFCVRLRIEWIASSSSSLPTNDVHRFPERTTLLDDTWV